MYNKEQPHHWEFMSQETFIPNILHFKELIIVWLYNTRYCLVFPLFGYIL